MRISEKIEAVRRKPASVRIRYVWGWVFISMIFVFLIWLLSISVTLKKQPANQPQPGGFDELKKSFESSKKNLPSLEDLPQTYPQQ